MATTYYNNPTAPPGEIAYVAAQVSPGLYCWRYMVHIHQHHEDGTLVPLYPYSGWGGTTPSSTGACNAATRRARTLVRCASQGLPVP